MCQLYPKLFIGIKFDFISKISYYYCSVSSKERVREDNVILNDLASGVFNASYSLGAIIGPILGGFLNSLVGYRYTNDILGFFALFITLLYGIFNTNRQDFRLKRTNEVEES